MRLVDGDQRTEAAALVRDAARAQVACLAWATTTAASLGMARSVLDTRGPQRLAALLRPEAVLDQQGRLAAGEFPSAEPWQLVVKSLDGLGAFRNLQRTDQLLGKFSHGWSPSRDEKRVRLR